MKKWRPSGSVSWTQFSGSTGTAPPPLKSEVLLLKEDAGLPVKAAHKMGQICQHPVLPRCELHEVSHPPKATYAPLAVTVGAAIYQVLYVQQLMSNKTR